jgi:hypothetical protein
MPCRSSVISVLCLAQSFLLQEESGNVLHASENLNVSFCPCCLHFLPAYLLCVHVFAWRARKYILCVRVYVCVYGVQGSSFQAPSAT